MDAQVRLNISVQRDTLVKALALVAPFVDKRNTTPILECVWIHAGFGAAVTLTGTDLDKTITVPLPCDFTPGAVCVPVHSFHKLVKGLPKGAAVTLTQDGDYLAIGAGAALFRLPTRPAADFPVEPLEGLKSTFPIVAPLLREMIAKTKFAMSTEQTRFYLHGLCLNVQATPGTLYAAATDGHRLAEFSIPTPCGAATFTADEHSAGVIIPRSTVLALEKILPKAGGVLVSLYAERLMFTALEWTVVSKTVDGTFPDWKRVIPQAGDVLRFDSTAARQAIANVTAISAERSRAVRLELTRTAALFSCTTPDAGTASSSVPAQWAGEPMEIRFSGRYLTELLELIPGDVEMCLTDAGSPVRITDPADPRVLYVLMPMRGV